MISYIHVHIYARTPTHSHTRTHTHTWTHLQGCTIIFFLHLCSSIWLQVCVYVPQVCMYDTIHLSVRWHIRRAQAPRKHIRNNVTNNNNNNNEETFLLIFNYATGLLVSHNVLIYICATRAIMQISLSLTGDEYIGHNYIVRILLIGVIIVVYECKWQCLSSWYYFLNWLMTRCL